MATELAPGATGQDLTADLTADRELKARHRATWALGAYPDVARRVVPGLGAVLVEACGVRPGDRVLDVGAGTGNAAIPAAERGAQVLATDLTPELLAAGRHRVEGRDLALQWQEADAEALPLPDGGFDVVLSCIGAMFAPHHRATADELVRVCRPGGTIGMLNWTPEGFIGRLFAAMKPFLPPPPPGVQPPPLWGDEQHVPRSSGTTSARTTAPSWPPTGPARPIRRAPRPWTPRSRTSPVRPGSTRPAAARWTGSTCCWSPVASEQPLPGREACGREYTPMGYRLWSA